MSSNITALQGTSSIEQGRARYQNKDYKGALKAFTNAVNESTGFMLLQALECRAAAFEKLDDLQSALKDSRRMINLKPELAKGYLRCGKVLQLKNENELALKIYERGLLKVKIGTDDQRPLLQKIYNKLLAIQSPGKVLDPLRFLPLELAQMMCQYLNVRDRVICLAVSKDWKRLLESMHKLWMTLDTTSARKAIGFNSLKAYLRRSNYTLNHAIISTKAGFDSTKLQFLTEKCKGLKALDMRGTGIVSGSLAAALPHARQLQMLSTSKNIEVTLTGAAEALRNTQKTIVSATFLNIVRGSQSMDFGSLERLKDLEMRSRSGINLNLVNLQSATPNIVKVTLHYLILGQRFDVVDFSPWQRLETLTLSESNLQSFPIFPSSLKHLYLENNHLMNVDAPAESIKLPLLESLSVLQCLQISPAALFAIVKESNQSGLLKYLDVGGRFHEITIAAAQHYPPSNTVEFLGLSNMPTINDKELVAIVDLYPSLTRIDLEGTAISGVGLKYVVNRGVKSVNVNFCERLGEDAVIWARAQDVQVQHNMIRPQQQMRYRDVLADRY